MHTHRLTVGREVVRKRYVSWDNDEPDREWAGLRELERHVPGLAPTPIARHTEGDAPVVVMSRLPGVPLGKEPLTWAQTNAFATALRRLFSAPVQPGTPERVLGPSTMRPFLREWASNEYRLDNCRDPGCVDQALECARAWLAHDDPDHDRVVDPVLAFGDGNLANVLWDGTTCRLVDFEEFGASDIAYEVADVVEHASSRLCRLLDVESLLDRLDLNSDQSVRLFAYRQLMAIFWLVMLLPGNSGFLRNPAGSTEDQARHVLTMVRT